jgi:hypothetical protein
MESFASALLLVGMGILRLPVAHASEFRPGETVSEDEPGLASGDDALQEVLITASRHAYELESRNRILDERRDIDLLPKLGATSYATDAQALQALPQGKNTPLDKLLLQDPGVSYDSAVSNPDFHVRNEYANVQYRINGIQLPEGVSALGPVLETGFIGNLNLLDGALPAQYGLRTAGVVDITSKTAYEQSGNLDVTAGTWSTLSPSIEYGGSAGQTQYFATGRFLQSSQGLENAMPAQDPIHDRTTQEKFFGYGSTLFGDATRLTYMAGGFVGQFQIPDLLGQQPLGDYGPSNLASTQLNENETDHFFFALLALQQHREALDLQVSLYTRYAAVNFVPDVFDDLAFNDVASNVARKSLLGGLQFDASDRLSNAHTLRAGFELHIERTQVDDLATVLPLAPEGTPLPTPVTRNDYDAKLGTVGGVYLQDEWRLQPQLTLNTGLRLDQMSEFVSAAQLSPRIALLFRPGADTTLHAGVSRYFTPPMQAQSTPNNLVLFQNTTQQSAVALDDPARPERASYFDAGLEQQLSPAMTAGLDLYYKRSTDTLDDGQFGEAVVLNQYNYAQGFSRGAELKIRYFRDGFRAYANLSHEITMVKNVVSNQYLIADPAELAYLAAHYTYGSDAQTVSASAGMSYRWQNMLVSVDGIYGSGLRAGYANEGHSPGYAQWNAAVGRDFHPWPNARVLSVRLSAINLLDRSYLLRSATGVGEFAPQYGPRRGLFIDVSQQL